MNSIKLMCAAAMIAGALGAPAYAQMSNDSMMKKDGMMSSKMKMSASDKKMMTKCSGMSHDMMMKDKGCMKMMKMHPDMMKGG
jgi:type IV secretory pathway TrbL component